MYRQPLRLLSVLCLLGIAPAFAAQVSAESGPLPSSVTSVAAATGSVRQPSSSVRSSVPPSGNGRAIPHARATTTSATSTICVPKASTVCPGPASSGTAPGVRAVATEAPALQPPCAGLRNPGAAPCGGHPFSPTGARATLHGRSLRIKGTAWHPVTPAKGGSSRSATAEAPAMPAPQRTCPAKRLRRVPRHRSPSSGTKKFAANPGRGYKQAGQRALGKFFPSTVPLPQPSNKRTHHGKRRQPRIHGKPARAGTGQDLLLCLPSRSSLLQPLLCGTDPAPDPL